MRDRKALEYLSRRLLRNIFNKNLYAAKWAPTVENRQVSDVIIENIFVRVIELGLVIILAFGIVVTSNEQVPTIPNVYHGHFFFRYRDPHLGI